MPFRFILTLTCVLTIVGANFAAPIPKESEKGKVSQETIKKWFDEGAEVFNSDVGRFGENYAIWSELDQKEREGMICFQLGVGFPPPNVRFREPKLTFDISELPQPEAPFALETVGLNLTEEDMKGILRLKNLFYLGLHKCTIHQDDFSRIQDIKSLRYIAIDRTTMSDLVIQSLAEIVNLEGLILDDCNLTDAQFEKLTSLKNLRSISISCDGLSKKTLVLLEKFPKLENLELKKMKFSDAEFASLQKIKNLKHLRLVDTSIKEGCFKEIGKLVNLEGLELAYPENPIPVKSLEPVFNLKKIQRFVCNNVTFEGTVTSKCSGWGEMNTVSLTDCTISDEFFSGFESLKKLKALCFYRANISDKLLQNLPVLDSLEYVNCNSTEISDEAFTKFKVSASFKKLDLRGTKVTQKCLKNFVSAKLEVLKVQDFEIDEAGLKNYLSVVSNPNEIDLPECLLTLEALKAISKMKNLKSVKIGLKKCEIDHIKELAKWRHIRKIEFRSEDIDVDYCWNELYQKKRGGNCSLTFAEQRSNIGGVQKRIHIGDLKFEQKPQK